MNHNLFHNLVSPTSSPTCSTISSVPQGEGVEQVGELVGVMRLWNRLTSLWERLARLWALSTNYWKWVQITEKWAQITRKWAQISDNSFSGFVNTFWSRFPARNCLNFFCDVSLRFMFYAFQQQIFRLCSLSCCWKLCLLLYCFCAFVPSMLRSLLLVICVHRRMMWSLEKVVIEVVGKSDATAGGESQPPKISNECGLTTISWGQLKTLGPVTSGATKNIGNPHFGGSGKKKLRN